MTSTGEILLEPIYDEISLTRDLCHFVRTIDGVKKEGAFLLNTPNEILPAIFHKCNYKDGKWMVMNNQNDSWAEFHPSQSALSKTVEYRDEGERYYEQGKYDDVIKFYAEKGIDAAWAKFFTGKAFQQKAESEMDVARNFWGDATFHSKTEIPFIDWDMIKSQYEVAKLLFEQYLNEDSTYYEQAKKGISYCDDEIFSISHEIPQKQFQKTIQRVQQEAAERKQRNLERQQRQAAIANSIITGFIGSIMGRYGGNQTSSKASSSSSSTTQTVSSSSSDISSSSTISSTPQKKKCRVCNGTGREPHETYLGSSSDSKKKWCGDCGKEVYVGHSHKTCSLCHESGLY